ncbi:cell death-inducing p53-target protein 1 [Biomphalaria glabrata]
MPSAGYHVDPNQHGGHPPSGYPPSGYPPAGACPPPQGYQASAGQTTVIVQPMNMPLPGANFRFMQFPAYIVCQHCQATVTTSTEYTTGLLTWAVAGVICLFGLWLGCCLIPFCIDGTKDVIHRCPNCKQVVGKFAHF